MLQFVQDISCAAANVSGSAAIRHGATGFGMVQVGSYRSPFASLLTLGQLLSWSIAGQQLLGFNQCHSHSFLARVISRLGPTGVSESVCEGVRVS